MDYLEVMMIFSDWFESDYRSRGERAGMAVARAALAADLAPMTIERARAGRRLRPATAEKLAAITDGKVTAASLVFASRRER